MKGKQKYEGENLFAGDLLRDEQVLWIDQPDAGRIFTRADVFYVPFSLLWCGFVIFWNAMVWSMSAPTLFRLWGVPFLLVGLYMVVGRFFYKAWRKRRTFYAVTDKRLLIKTTTWGQHVTSYYLNTLPHLEKFVGWGDVGNLTFGAAPAPSWWNRRQLNVSNSGFEFMGYALPGFYDIHNVNDVYLLISELRDEFLEAERDEVDDGYAKAKRYH